MHFRPALCIVIVCVPSRPAVLLFAVQDDHFMKAPVCPTGDLDCVHTPPLKGGVLCYTTEGTETVAADCLLVHLATYFILEY